MPYDHYHPAAYVGRFSLEVDRSPRDRAVWVADRRTHRVFCASAARVGGVNDLYTLRQARRNPRFLDDMWTGYEPKLTPAIDNLIARKIDAQLWATGLVEFVSALLVRGLDFKGRFENRMAHMFPTFHKELGPDNTNLGRWFEWRRLRASVLGANWEVLETSGNLQQFTNDLAYAPLMKIDSSETGIAIPLGHFHILVITPMRQRVVAYSRGGQWWPTIRHFTIDDREHENFLRSIARCAQRFIVGPTEASVRRALEWIGEMIPPRPVEPGRFGFFTGHRATYFENLYWQFLSLISVPPDIDGRRITVNFNLPKSELEGVRVRMFAISY